MNWVPKKVSLAFQRLIPMTYVWGDLSRCFFFYAESGNSYAFFCMFTYFFFRAPGFHSKTQSVVTKAIV